MPTEPTPPLQLLRIIEQAAGYGVWEWIRQEDRLVWSARCGEIYGVAAGGIRTFADWVQLIHPDDRARVLSSGPRNLDRPGPGDQFTVEFRTAPKSGNPDVQWIRSSGIAFRNARGEVETIAGINCDISEQKRLEAELALQVEALSRMAEGVSLVDLTGRIIYTNPRFDTLYGYESGELAGRQVSLLNSPNASDPEVRYQEIADRLGMEGVWEGENLARHKSGEDFWIRAKISVFHHPTLGDLWIAVIDDISDLRRMTLERELNRRQLARMASQLQLDEEAYRRNLARDLHDGIGAALTGVRMQVDAFPVTPGNAEQEQVRLNLLSVIDRALQSTRSLCTELRPPMLDHLGVAETVRWWVKEWRRQTGIKVTARLERLSRDPGDTLSIDLFRIVQELMTNIAKHANASRVRLTLTERPVGLRLTVEDDGVGYVDRPTNGIGLIGVRERALRHGGSMTIDGNPGSTVVRVFLPHRPT